MLGDYWEDHARDRNVRRARMPQKVEKNSVHHDKSDNYDQRLT